MKLPSLIKPNVLNKILSENKTDNLKILDCTYPLRRGYNNFIKQRIPNALFLDIQNLKNKNSNLALEFPQPEEFKHFLQNLNIARTNNIICYENSGIYSSPRAWFIFKAYGFENVSILDGALPQWVKSGYQLDKTPITDEQMKNYSYFTKNTTNDNYDDLTYDKNLLTKYEDIINKGKDSEIIDTRPSLYYKMGKIPDSKNISFEDFTDKEGYFKNKEELQELFSKNEISLTPEKNLISSCGIGLSACIAVFAAKELLGHEKVKLYNGSYEEYAQRIKN